MYPKLFKIGRNWLLEFFDPVLIRKIRKLIKILANPYYTRALFKGVAAAIEHEQVLANLSCSLVVDIGANRGAIRISGACLLPRYHDYINRTASKTCSCI